jgi:hypothetical protein
MTRASRTWPQISGHIAPRARAASASAAMRYATRMLDARCAPTLPTRCSCVPVVHRDRLQRPDLVAAPVDYVMAAPLPDVAGLEHRRPRCNCSLPPAQTRSSHPRRVTPGLPAWPSAAVACGRPCPSFQTCGVMFWHHRSRTDPRSRPAGEAQLAVFGSTATQPDKRSWAQRLALCGRSSGFSREGPTMPDNILLIMRFHPVGGDDVSVVRTSARNSRRLRRSPVRWTSSAVWS